MHWPKSSNMTKTCYHHMLFVGGVGFYSKITFLTPLSRSKVICRSKSCDMLGQGQWSFPPSLVKIGQVMTELQRDWQKKERILQRQNKTACLPSCKEGGCSKCSARWLNGWIQWFSYSFVGRPMTHLALFWMRSLGLASSGICLQPLLRRNMQIVPCPVILRKYHDEFLSRQGCMSTIIVTQHQLIRQ